MNFDPHLPTFDQKISTLGTKIPTFDKKYQL
jgi:hypothetical protein